MEHQGENYMRYENYSEDAFYQHSTDFTDELKLLVQSIDDATIRKAPYDIAMLLKRYVDSEDENAMGATNHVESKLDELSEDVGKFYVANDYEERITDLESQVSKTRG